MIDLPENHQPLPIQNIEWGTPIQDIKLPYEPVQIKGNDLSTRTWRFTMFGKSAYLMAWGTQSGFRLWRFSIHLPRLHTVSVWNNPEVNTIYQNALTSLITSYEEPDQTFDFKTQPELIYKLQHLKNINDYTQAAYWYSQPLKVHVGAHQDNHSRWCYDHKQTCTFSSVIMDFELSYDSHKKLIMKENTHD